MPDYTIWIFNASKYILNIEAQMHVPSRHINSFHTESSAQPSIGSYCSQRSSCIPACVPKDRANSMNR